MSQDFVSSWSVEFPAHSATAHSTPERIALAPCVQHPLPENQVLLVRRHSEVRTVVTNEVMQALGLCSALRTLDQHAQAIASAMPHLVEDVNDARAVLLNLKAIGLFINSTELERLLAHPVSTTRSARPTVACIATSDRPELLERVLASLFDHNSERPATSCFVIDDSREPANITKNREITQQMAATGNPVAYVGPEEQAATVAQLSRQLPDLAPEIEFLLGRAFDTGVASYGRVMNHALLRSAGAALVYIDDDSLCRGYRAPVEPNGQLVADGSIREASFFSSEQPWESAPGDTLDPVSELSRFVGRSVPEALQKLQEESNCQLQIEGIYAQDAVQLARPGSSIMATVCGIYGDPGTAGNQWIFGLSDESLARLTESEEGYRRALSERNLWLGCGSGWLGRHHTFLSAISCFDHTRLLPPALPIFRNEDFLYGKMLPLLHSDSYVLELPWAVPHLPAQRRSWDPRSLDQPAPLSFSHFTGLYLNWRANALLSRDPSSRLHLIGEVLTELGRSAPAEMEDEYRNTLAWVRADLVTRLDRQLQGKQGMPPYLQEDLIRQMRANQQALVSDFSRGPGDLSRDFPDADLLTLSGSLWRRYGKALQAWERMVSAFRESSS